MSDSCVVLGGTFDPIHNGHIQAASELTQTMGYPQITLMPCGLAYHKAVTQSPNDQRLTMLSLGTKHYPELLVDERELQRDGPTYTVDTLAEFRQELGKLAHICWVVGQDAAQTLDQWYDWQRIFELANLIVIARPGEDWPNTSNWPADLIKDADDFKKRPNGAFFCTTLTPLAISSSMVRNKVKNQQSIDDLVPSPVVNWIEANGLYR